MATQPAPPVPKRRPVAAQHVPGLLGARALRLGLRATLLAPLGAAASVALVADQDPKAGAFVPVVLGIAALGVGVTFLPWDWLAGTAWGQRVLHLWAALDLLLITLAGWSAAGADAALPLGYAVTIVFFVVVFPPRAQLVYVGALLACYGAVLVSSHFELLPFAMLGVMGLLACFLSREVRKRLSAHERARVAAERRWAVIGAVSTAAREATDAEPTRVLQGIVEAIVSLGYQTTAIHVADGDVGPLVVLPGGMVDDAARAVRSLPDAIRSDVLVGGRAVVVAAADADRHTMRALRASGVEALAATPIVVGGHPEAVLLVGSADPNAITPREMDAFAMLAAHAALALVNARRDEERRAVADRVSDADRLKADVIARLSQEVRKPLAIVTETSRALQQNSETDDRHRLLQRLATSATALDVTLGGMLDLSLLQADTVELDVRSIDLGELVSRVADRLAGLFEERELRLHAPTGLTVDADPALIERAVENLLATAATSTSPGRAVEVTVSRAGDQTIVKVAGEGAIPADQIARIRQPFAIGAGGPAGPVVRLALASRILEIHGTELEVRSEPTQGTRVWFRLPGTRDAGSGAVGIRLATGTGEPVQLTLEDAILPAVAARAAMAVPPPPAEDQEEDDEGARPSRMGAAAAALATVASTMVVTGLVPDLTEHPVTIDSPDRRDPTRPDRAKAARSKEGTNDQGSTSGGTAGGSADPSSSDGSSNDTTSTGGTGTGGTDGGDGGGGSGDGSGGTGDEDPVPPAEDDSPGKSGEAPGHNKKKAPPSPSPSP